MTTHTNSHDERLALCIKTLRLEKGWSLETLSRLTGVRSCATLSRIENAAVSPTASVLNKLCGAFGMSTSRLMQMAEDTSSPYVCPDSQPIFEDSDCGFSRRTISPYAENLAGEVQQYTLLPHCKINHEKPQRWEHTHHLIMQHGQLKVAVASGEYLLNQGDCLRYRPTDFDFFETGPENGAQYLLLIV